MCDTEKYPCPDCEFCKKPKTWEQTKYVKCKTFMNKDACLECYKQKKEEEEMEEWVMNDMYEGLLKMPLWVLSAFGSLNDGDTLRTGDVRLELIYWLVVQSMNKCPTEFYNTDYRSEWKVGPYIPLVKQAVGEARKTLKM